MPRLAVAVPHALTQEEAISRLQGFLDLIKRQYESQISDLQETWEDKSGNFKFRAMGFKVDGSLQVDPSEVRIDGSLPLAAMMFKGRIEETIRQQLGRILS